ncbi:Os08g0555650, partial [Oryza sativa Japonica Group]
MRRRRRRRRRDAGGELAAALGEAALELVRVLVAAQRLRAVEPAPAVGAREGAVVAGGGERRRRVPGGRGVLPAGRRGVDQPQVEVDVAG